MGAEHIALSAGDAGLLENFEGHQVRRPWGEPEPALNPGRSQALHIEEHGGGVDDALPLLQKVSHRCCSLQER